MKEVKRALKILQDWTQTDSMDAVVEVCEVIEILEKYIKENKPNIKMSTNKPW